jgi:(E)-4-hydroxy-3-methylbut-2-enyl-diphosphate synthase
LNHDYKYCNSLTSYSRFRTRVIQIGNVPLGGHFPIRIQSMTNTNTLDTIATVDQSIRLIEAGCEYVRITAPGMKEAENLAKIKKELHTRGFDVPLIADIHFNPAVAETAARIVEKIRINPGNYVDKKRFEKIDYSDSEYQEEIDKIRERISPLIKICKEYGTAMRIGTNHGSLSDRIMSRYGDTPQGMVQSAMEFISICEDLEYNNLVLSMKASNIRVMVEAYRLLVHNMMKKGMDYPLHVGVTEAGSGEEGRIKSAAGIGTLLEDGIGDTIRVSLTELPEEEISVARLLAGRYAKRNYHGIAKNIESPPVNPFEFHRHFSNTIGNIGNGEDPVVVISSENVKQDSKADYVFLKKIPDQSSQIWPSGVIWDGSLSNKEENLFSLFNSDNYFRSKKKSADRNFVLVSSTGLTPSFIEKVKKDSSVILVIKTAETHAAAALRKMFFDLISAHCKCPVIIRRKYEDVSEEEFMTYASTDIGLLMADGLGDGIWLEAEGIPGDVIERTSFNILQATGARIYKTEFVSCPTCGRTSYNILETLQRIKQFTGHLKGLKIAIMGCVVNGPGEMADADYGYVGSMEGKINLYKGKHLVQRNIDEQEALDALINLIKENGDWVEE